MDAKKHGEIEQATDEWLVGGGRMGALIRATDWSGTPLGPRASWPQSLRTTLNLCLASNFPLCFTWGPARVQIYNDGYWPICGAKHPTSMGQDYGECWGSAWAVIGPGFERCMSTGETTFVTDTRMFLDRHGYLEETFFTYSYSPIRDETGGIGGIFHPVTETTHLVLAERRLSAIRALAVATADTKTVDEALRLSAAALVEHALDVPFALLYRMGPGDGDDARLVGASGVGAGEHLAPERTSLTAQAAWPLGTVVATGRPLVVDGLGDRHPSLAAGPYPEPPNVALVMPICVASVSRPLAVMVAGVSSRRALDDTYRQFYELLAGAVMTAVSNAFAYEEQHRRAEALAEIDRAKTAFFSNISHEFRTPLTLMLGPLEDLLAGAAGAVPEAMREPVEVAHRNGLRLLKLVNALLEFSRLEAGRVEAVFEPTELGALTAELASTFRSAIEKAGLELLVDCPPLAEPVHVDPGMWETVVLNLLSNAFKFTLTGHIAVRQGIVGDFVALSVADTGVGIPTAELGKVFERFHRIEGSAGRTHEGTGIGLALVQELVKLHGGEARVESSPGQGTTFTVTVRRGTGHLPHDRVAVAQDRLQVGAASFVEEALRWLPTAIDDAVDGVVDDREHRRPRVLLADDNADMREYVARLLASHFDVIVAADGVRALESAREVTPDLVLSDVMMPRLDGFGLLAALRADPCTAAVPVVLLSARAGEEATVEGLDAGADDYLIKPFSGKELLARVRSTLEMARLRQDAARRQARELTLHEEARRKDAFVAMLAHELRNPLGVLCNAAEILRAHQDPATSHRICALIGRQVGHLSRIVEEILDVARVSHGKIALQRERLDFAQLVVLAAQDEAHAFAAAGVKLELGVSEIPMWVSGDRTRLTQVITNLLANAVKFTDRGGAVVVDARGDGANAVLTVTDTGVGIPPELMPHLFEAFTQADKTLDRSRGGLGLGLSMVKGLVELHGGETYVESRGQDQGASFRITLPRLAELPALCASSLPAACTQARSRVLVIEDNRDSADTLQLLLELAGCEVRAAYTGPEGVQAALDMMPDLVLCDIGLPGMNGYEVARTLRTSWTGKRPLLVALTGYGDESDRVRAREAGFDRHFTKPIDPTALGALLAS